MKLQDQIGLGRSDFSDGKTLRYVKLKLALLGLPTGPGEQPEIDDLTSAILSHQHETDRLLADYLSPADQRIQNYLTAIGVAVRAGASALAAPEPG